MINALKAVYLQLSAARERYEKELERKQRSVARYIPLHTYVYRQSKFIINFKISLNLINAFAPMALSIQFNFASTTLRAISPQFPTIQ